MENNIRIAICQMDIVWENKCKNYDKAAHFNEEAAKNGADIILFPEMSTTGFSMNIALTKEQNNESIQFFKEQAIKFNISIGFGWVKANGTMAENHYTILDKNGEEILDYTKIHPFSYSYENQYFIPGNEIKHCTINGIETSAFICYDLRFPELFQAASKSAKIVIVPANWPEKRSEHWKCLLRARAIENQVYMLGINCVGDKNGLYYSGDSCIIDPKGNVLQMLSDKEGLIIQDIQDDVNAIRDEFPVKLDRNIQLYKSIL